MKSARLPHRAVDRGGPDRARGRSSGRPGEASGRSCSAATPPAVVGGDDAVTLEIFALCDLRTGGLALGLCGSPRLSLRLGLLRFLALSQSLLRRHLAGARHASVAIPALEAASASSTTTTTAPATASAATPGALVLGLVHLQRAAAELRPVESADRVRRGACLRHLDEPEPARPPGLAIRDHADRLHVPLPLEDLAQLVLRGGEGKVPDVQLLAHLKSSSQAPSNGDANWLRSRAPVRPASRTPSH